jgi:tetratricopeptide (TPR) repeat protein
VAAALFVLAATLSAVSGVRAVAADRLSRDAIRAREVDVALERAEAAIHRAPRDIRHRLLLARSHEQERSLGGVDRAIDAIDAALDISPLEPTALLERARLLSLRAAITGTGTDRLAAAQAWDDVITRSPYCARCHLGAGLAALERGDIEAARSSLTTAADLGNAQALVILDRVSQE